MCVFLLGLSTKKESGKCKSSKIIDEPKTGEKVFDRHFLAAKNICNDFRKHKSLFCDFCPNRSKKQEMHLESRRERLKDKKKRKKD